MEYYAPLLQTLLWVSLITGIVFRFHRQLDSLLTAITQRIEAGGTVKAGPFELGELKSQDPIQQQQRADAEIQELLQAEDEPKLVASNEKSANIKSRFFEAEDLALRAIQIEYDRPISRQVSAGKDMGFDGAFTIDHRLYLVEIKYVVREKNASQSVRRTLETLVAFLTKNRLGNVEIIVAVVFEYVGDLSVARERLNAMAADFSVPVTFRCYQLADLRKRFGVSESDNG